MKEQPILGYDWEMGHEEIKLEIDFLELLQKQKKFLLHQMFI